MAKLLQTYSNSLQTVAADGLIGLGNVTRSYNACNTIVYNGTNSISLNQPGYYNIQIEFIATNNSEATTDVEILQDDNLMWLIQETSSATTDILHLTGGVIVRVLPNCCANITNVPSVITFKNAGTTEIDINAVNVRVIKVV